MLQVSLLIFFQYLFSLYPSPFMPPTDFRSIFNGKDLSGWSNVNCAPETWSVRDGMIICTGFPTGVLRTEHQYENFILELEWRHLHKDGNAGLFIHSDALTAPGQPFTRSIECQIMDGNEGDMFAIHGARLIPDNEDPFEKVGWMRSFPKESRMNPTGQWNQYRIESRDGILTLAVNGEIVTRGFYVVPRKGYICLESEGSEVHFRNIRIRELPGRKLPPELVAEEGPDFHSLYNGLDLRGWKSDNSTGWKPDNWKLVCESGNPGQALLSERKFSNYRLIADWCLNGDLRKKEVPVILSDGNPGMDEEGHQLKVPIRDAGQASILLRGPKALKLEITSWPLGSGSLVDRNGNRLAIPVFNMDSDPGKWNRFEITVTGQLISVLLNGETLFRDVTLPDIPEEGPIGLVFEGAPIQFANLYIQELK